MRALLLIVFAVMASSMSSTASAQLADAENIQFGNGLWEVCKDDNRIDWVGGQCAGYIQGVVDMGQYYRVLCFPKTVINKQVFGIVRRGLANHPEERHNGSIPLILKYLGANFSCSKR